MAREEIFFGINIDTGEVIKDFGTLKKRTKELKKELDGTKVGTKRFEELKTEITRNQATIRRFNRELRDTKSLATRVGQGMTNAFKKVGGVIAGAFAVNQTIEFAKRVADITAQFEKLRAVLSNTLGSKSEADKAFKNIQQFASRTNFSVLELSNAFVKLTNQGFKPTMEEMENLADLANSTGKDFDQLAEAIIDAQVGEFERLKEFGIRAKKEGDNVKFTFKGVEEQVKFTEKEIRKYILSLGDLEGVSGSTEKISKTLGGAISNLGDAFDSFLAGLGDADSLLGSVIRNVVNLSSSFLKIITPSEKASEALSKQKTELNILVQRITDTNTKEEERLNLIKQLNSVYPGFLENQNKEKLTNEQIRDRLEEVNKELINNLTLKIQDEKLQEKAQKAAELQNELFEDEIRVRKLINSINDEYGYGLDLTTGSLDENVKALKSLLEEKAEIVRFDKQGFPIANRQLKDVNKISDAYRSYTSIQKELLGIEKEVNEEQQKKRDLINRLFNGVEPKDDDIEKTKQRDKELDPTSSFVDIDPKDSAIVKFQEQVNNELEKLGVDRIEKTEGIKRKELEVEQEHTRLLELESEKRKAIDDAILMSSANLAGGIANLLASTEESRKKNAELIKKFAIAQVGINTALEIKNILATNASPTQPGNIFTFGGAGAAASGIQITAAIASGAAQIATISSQKFAKGGILQGASHEQGGIKTPYGELEGGEAVINKKSTKKYGGILSAINEAEGGVKFARGGILGVPSVVNKPIDLSGQILSAIENIQINPTVSVVEINEAQTRLIEIENNSTL